jgi:hypothetical protein
MQTAGLLFKLSLGRCRSSKSNLAHGSNLDPDIAG